MYSWGSINSNTSQPYWFPIVFLVPIFFVWCLHRDQVCICENKCVLDVLRSIRVRWQHWWGRIATVRSHDLNTLSIKCAKELWFVPVMYGDGQYWSVCWRKCCSLRFQKGVTAHGSIKMTFVQDGSFKSGELKLFVLFICAMIDVWVRNVMFCFVLEHRWWAWQVF